MDPQALAPEVTRTRTYSSEAVEPPEVIEALRFRLSAANVDVGRVRELCHALGTALPEDLRRSIWGHLLLGSRIYEDRQMLAWDGVLDLPFQDVLHRDCDALAEVVAESTPGEGVEGASTSASEVSYDMVQVLTFYCKRREAPYDPILAPAVCPLTRMPPACSPAAPA